MGTAAGKTVQPSATRRRGAAASFITSAMWLAADGAGFTDAAAPVC
jgi:hypothetical protein